MTQAAQWGNWRPQSRSGEGVQRVRAWFRQVACPKCNSAIGRACRSNAGYPADHHRARRDAAGQPPYEEWRKAGLFQMPAPGPAAVPAILGNSRTMRTDFGVDQPIGDSVAIVSHVLADRLAIILGDESALDRFDDAARALVLARGPIGSADLVTVLTMQIANLVGIIAGPHGDPEAMFTGLVRDQIALTRRLEDIQKDIPE